MIGVSEVIAVILILMITISLAGLAYMFMSTTMSDVTSSAGSTVDTTTSSMITSFTIESISQNHIYVRNTGSNTLTGFSVYINDMAANYTAPASILPSALGTVNVSNVILSGDTIKVTSTNGITASRKATAEWYGAVVYWKFDEGSGTIAYDVSGTFSGTLTNMNATGNNFNGTIPSGWTSGKYSRGLGFDGANDFMLSSISSITAFSVSAWIYPLSTPTDSNIGQVIAANYAGDGFFLYLSSTRNISFRVDAATSYDIRCSSSIPLNQWSFAAATYDGTQSKIYLNGNLCGTIASSNNWLSSVFVGAASHTSGVTNNFNGTIDDVAIWNRVLTPEEISKLYSKA